MIDIGTWIGPTVLYCCQKFKHIYGVEADKESIEEINTNIKFDLSLLRFTYIQIYLHTKRNSVQSR